MQFCVFACVYRIERLEENRNSSVCDIFVITTADRENSLFLIYLLKMPCLILMLDLVDLVFKNVHANSVPLI